jgi:putative hydrolase of the HAD superfamily
MIKAVIFDLDNTLYDERCYFLKVFKIFCINHSVDFDQIQCVFTDELRRHSEDIFGDILKKINYYSVSRQNELFDLYKSIDCRLLLYDEAYEIISHIKRKKMKIAIITNGVVEAQKNKIKALGIQSEINHIIYARGYGKEYEKPNSMAFLMAIDALKVDVADAIYIGDHPDTDIKGAKGVGLKALRFINEYTSNLECNNCDNIRSLVEIKKYLSE